MKDHCYQDNKQFTDDIDSSKMATRHVEHNLFKKTS